MFNQTKIKQLAKLLDIEDIQKVEMAIKRQAKYLKVSSTFLLKSYVVITDIKKQIEDEEIKIDKYISKNLIINKYKNEIVELYKNQFGYLKIANSIYLNHNCKVSKSSIEHFIKSNNITRD
ncbi:MAG: hypothetical protein U9N59_08680 [Campylobacterota bacterium]|nr:hypothetical protein [Campylobacterota bacterium]